MCNRELKTSSTRQSSSLSVYGAFGFFVRDWEVSVSETPVQAAGSCVIGVMTYNRQVVILYLYYRPTVYSENVTQVCFRPRSSDTCRPTWFD